MNLANRAYEIFQSRGLSGVIVSSLSYLYNMYLFKYHAVSRRLLFSAMGHNIPQNQFNPIIVDVNDIKFVKSTFEQRREIGNIRGGNWDKHKIKKIENDWRYIGMYKHFNNNKNWEDTIYYKKAIEKICNNGHHFSCFSAEELKNRCEYVDELYDNIKRFGYQSTYHDNSGFWDKQRTPIVTPAHKLTGEVGINIGRNGDLILNDGIHRLSIAKILDLDTIPVQIIVRHAKWQKKRDKIATEGIQAGLSKYKTHPDIQLLNHSE